MAGSNGPFNGTESCFEKLKIWNHEPESQKNRKNHKKQKNHKKK